MPTYLLHGFRWPRSLIRIHIILQNLEDAAAEWLMAPKTIETMTANFNTCYPTIMDRLPQIHFIEQYDPMDESPESRLQPYAYVADTVHEIRLGMDLADLFKSGALEPSANVDAIKELSKALAGEAEIPVTSWYIVVCGDTERLAPVELDVAEFGSDLPIEVVPPKGSGKPNRLSFGKRGSSSKELDGQSRNGLSGLINRMRKSSSRRSLRSAMGPSETSSEPMPPLPPQSPNVAVCGT